MGVVYRLTPEISAFIINEKQKDPKATCQHLSGRVFLQFGRQVSKSSVHALLKQQQIITPRARKIKDTFKIPADKKNEISKALAPFAVTIAEPLPNASLIKKDSVQAAVNAPQLTKNAGEVLLTAVLGDLSFKPALGVTDAADLVKFKEEDKGQWEYLIQEIAAIRVQTLKGAFYLDPRFQGVYAQNPCQSALSVPVERAIGEATDKVLNNVEPLIIRCYAATDLNAGFYTFLEAFEGESSGTIGSISLVDAKAREYTCFNSPLSFKRHFMIGVSLDHPDMQWARNDGRCELAWPDEAFTLKLLRTEDMFIVTNLISMSYDDIIQMYQERHPSGGYQGFVAPKEKVIRNEGVAAQWIRAQLVDRARGFFSASSPKSIVESFMGLSGYEQVEKTTRRIFLQIADNNIDREYIVHAAELINSMDIKDGEKRKLLFFID